MANYHDVNDDIHEITLNLSHYDDQQKPVSHEKKITANPRCRTLQPKRGPQRASTTFLGRAAEFTKGWAQIPKWCLWMFIHLSSENDNLTTFVKFIWIYGRRSEHFDAAYPFWGWMLVRKVTVFGCLTGWGKQLWNVTCTIYPAIPPPKKDWNTHTHKKKKTDKKTLENSKSTDVNHDVPPGKHTKSYRQLLKLAIESGFIHLKFEMVIFQCVFCMTRGYNPKKLKSCDLQNPRVFCQNRFCPRSHQDDPQRLRRSWHLLRSDLMWVLVIHGWQCQLMDRKMVMVHTYPDLSPYHPNCCLFNGGDDSPLLSQTLVSFDLPMVLIKCKSRQVSWLAEALSKYDMWQIYSNLPGKLWVLNFLFTGVSFASLFSLLEMSEKIEQHLPKIGKNEPKSLGSAGKIEPNPLEMQEKITRIS